MQVKESGRRIERMKRGNEGRAGVERRGRRGREKGARCKLRGLDRYSNREREMEN